MYGNAKRIARRLLAGACADCGATAVRDGLCLDCWQEGNALCADCEEPFPHSELSPDPDADPRNLTALSDFYCPDCLVARRGDK